VGTVCPNIQAIFFASRNLRTVQTKRLPRSSRSFGVRGKCAGDELDFSIELRSHLVNYSDSSLASTTYHAHLYFSLHITRSSVLKPTYQSAQLFPYQTVLHDLPKRHRYCGTAILLKTWANRQLPWNWRAPVPRRRVERCHLRNARLRGTAALDRNPPGIRRSRASRSICFFIRASINKCIENLLTLVGLAGNDRDRADAGRPPVIFLPAAELFTTSFRLALVARFTRS
jgi:hypothetical protein